MCCGITNIVNVHEALIGEITVYAQKEDIGKEGRQVNKKKARREYFK